MRKFLLLFGFGFICLFITFFVISNAHANIYLKQGAYLEKNQWGALEDILSDWRTGKLTTDECALYGCYVLAAQEPSRNDRNEKKQKLPIKYKLEKKSVDKGPYFFVYFLYNNEEVFGKEAIEEFRASDWCEDVFLDSIFDNLKVKKAFDNFFSLSLIERKKIASLTRSGEYNFFEILEYISKENLIKPEAVYIAMMSEFDNGDKFYKKYKKFVGNYPVSTYGDFFNVAINIIPKISQTNNRKVVNIFNFYYNYGNVRQRYWQKSKFYKINDFEVSGGTDKENKLYYDYFTKYYEEITHKKGFLEPINFLNNSVIRVDLKRSGATPPLYGNIGSAKPLFGSDNVIYGYDIKLNLDDIEYQNSKKTYTPEKAVIHEFFHTIQASYVDKKNNFYWYLKENRYFVDNFKESTATWAEDFFYNDNKFPLQTIYQSAWYFFENVVAVDNMPISYCFPANGFNSERNYCLGFFWNYLSNLDAETSVKIIFENIIQLKPSQVLMNRKSFLDEYHNFAVNNFLINKNVGVDQNEELFSKAHITFNPLHSNFPELKILDDKLSTIVVEKGTNTKAALQVNAWSTNMVRIVPSTNYFDDSIIMKFTNQKSIKTSVVEAWIDVGSNDAATEKIKYLVRTLENEGAYSYYRYYTKKGINPKYLIVIATDAETEFNNKNIEFEIAVDKPFEIIADSIAGQINEAGERFKNDMVSIFSKNAISNMIAQDTEICKLYDDYLKNKNEFTAKQIVQKIRNLNLLMQTNMVAVHDLRYQYYLYKNSCVDKIIAGASSQSVIKQVEKLKKFIDEIKIDDYNNSLNVANAYIISNHAQMKLKSIKEVDPEEWDMGQATYDKINKIAKTITGNSKYPYWYTNVELQEAVSSPFIGIPEDECPGPLLIPGFPTKGPFPVNYCPGIRKQLDSLKIPSVYSISSKLKSISITVSGTTYNASNMLCVRDKFDPLSLAYFSALKKHRYHEDNMPPVPSVSNIRNYVSLLRYYMKICKNFSLCNSEELAYSKKIMISGASNRIMEIIVLISEAIIKEKQENKTELYEKYKQVVSESEYRSEILDLSEKQLARDGFRESN